MKITDGIMDDRKQLGYNEKAKAKMLWLFQRLFEIGKESDIFTDIGGE